MAQTAKGQKFNKIPAYDRVVDGKTVHVKAHDRSNPKTSSGKK